jgi:hypothetical protein
MEHQAVTALEARILTLRGERVILDADLAALYGVETKRLNQQVKRNREKFPNDFCFLISADEEAGLGNLRLQFATSSFRHGGRRHLIFAFTEHGAIQAANVLRSAQATQMSVHVVRAFVRLRRLQAENGALAAKLDELEGRVGEHDEQLAGIIEAIRQLAAPTGPEHGRKIGFHGA